MREAAEEGKRIKEEAQQQQLLQQQQHHQQTQPQVEADAVLVSWLHSDRLLL